MKIFVTICLAAIFYNACERPPHQEHVSSNRDGANVSHASHTMESSQGAEDAPFELQFIDTMIAHHQGAIDMALLVKTRSNRAEIQDFAEKILAAQRSEVEQLRKIRKERHGEVAPAVNMNLPGMKQGMDQMDIKKLELLKAGDFDKEFVAQMIPHHEGAVIMAKDLLNKNAETDLKDIAKKIISDQDSEIVKLKKWQAEF